MEVIKSWEFEDERSWQKINIDLFFDQVVFTNRFNQSSKVFSFDMVLENNAPLADLKTDYELLKEIVKLIERDILSEKAKAIYDFYKSFENNGFTEKKVELEVKVGNSESYFYTLTAYGIRTYYLRDGQVFDQYKQRLSSFFFEGPQRLNIDFNIRKEWRIILWKSLKNNTFIRFDNAFVLFDYNKIKVVKYDYYNNEEGEGQSLYINKGSVDIGKWSKTSLAGGVHSIEEIWYNPHLITPVFEKHRSEIHKILKAAIVSINDETSCLNESPNTAPPA